MLQHIGTMAGLLRPTQPPREATCRKHGTYESRNVLASIWTQCPTCLAEEREAETRQQAEADRAARQAKWQAQLGEAGIPERFRDRTLKNYIANTPAQRHALEFSLAYAAEFDRSGGKRGHSGRCALFVGNPGTGKNHLACAIALRAMGRFGASALYTTVSRMDRRIREAKSFNGRETESQAIAVFTYPDLLIVDEVGLQSHSDAEARALFDVINERYENRKPTIFLSNLDTEGVERALGPRVFDRIREDGGEVVVFDWQGMRGNMGRAA